MNAQEGLNDGQKFSKYNSGVAQIFRLDGLWRDVNTHSRMGLFRKWNADLDRLWCELSKDLKDDEKYKTKKANFDNLDKEIEDLGNFEDNAEDSFEGLSKEQIKKRYNQYKKLMEKELFLRRLENFLGKGTAWDEEEDDF